MVDIEKGDILHFNKPYEWTSFDVVNRVRRVLCRHYKVKKLKVGHTGTLDPLATGVVTICIGKATKQIERLQYDIKEYVATLKLGATTPSFDMEHPEDKTYPTEHITDELVKEVVGKFIGEIWQIPPIFSAVKVNGKRAYEVARSGGELELKPKLLVIDEIEVLDFKDMHLTIRVVCSKGTYIRALARDIGEALGSGAYLTMLKRTRIGDVKLEDCLEVDEFAKKLNV